MWIPRNAKIEAAVCPDQFRYGLTHIRVDCQGPSPVLVATNGNILAVVPVELEPGDTEGDLPAAVVAEARKACGRKVERFSVKANGHIEYATKVGTVTLPRKEFGRFPDWRSVVPDADRLTVGPSKDFRVGIDPSLLLSVSEAIGAGRVELRFGGALDPILVYPCAGPHNDTAEWRAPKAWGIIMPVRIG